jgi:hypothetical protein
LARHVNAATGKEPALSSYAVSKLNGKIPAEMNIAWKGGFLGANYRTTVVWEFSAQEHVSAKVTFDRAPASISRGNVEMLDDYFRTKIYPVLLSDMGQ